MAVQSARRSGAANSAGVQAAIRLAAHRLPHAGVALARRHRGGHQPQSGNRAEGPPGPVPVLGPRARHGAVHPGVAHRPPGRRRERLLPVAAAPARARPDHRGRIRRARWADRVGSATAATSASSATSRRGRAQGPPDGRRRGFAVHARRRLGAGHHLPSRRARGRRYRGAMAVVLGGEASVATNGFWSSLTMATTLRLPLLFYIEDNGLGISVPGDMQTPGGNIATNLASFGNLFVRDGDGTDPDQTARLLRRGDGPRARGTRSGADAPDGAAALAATRDRTTRRDTGPRRRSPRTGRAIRCPRLHRYLVPVHLPADAWTGARGRGRARRGGRARGRPRAPGTGSGDR